MKAVRRLAAEPVGLASYRVANSGEDVAPPDQAKAVWDRFRDEPAYSELLRALVDVQQGLCIYCEQRLVSGEGELVSLDYQVEHVEPKAGAPGRALDWRNLAAACGGGCYPHHRDPSRCGTGRANQSCGQRKGDGNLGPGCDPRTFPPMIRLADVGELDGRLTANPDACDALGLDPLDLAETIEQVLNLNCERLRKARQDVGDNVRSWFVPLLTELLDGTHLTTEQQGHMLGLWVAGRLQPDAGGYLHAFWTTERCALGDPADAWVDANLALFA